MTNENSSGLAVRLQQSTPIPLDAEFSCAPGQILALIGPSGSGKTTILRSIAGLYRPESGRISHNGEFWYDSAQRIDLAPQVRRAGMVFQDYALFPHKSALENVAIALGHLPHTERRARAQEILARVNMEGLENRRPDALSGGQRQRVAVARALAREPRALLLDEPFSAVDQATRRRLQRELLILRRNLDLPIVLVTHDLREATSLADQMALLYRGRILQTGPPDEVTMRPVSTQAARLVDLTNIFQARIVGPAPDAGHVLIDWKGEQLTVATDHEIPAGEQVQWVIPPSSIVLHRRGRPSLGERENPLEGEVSEVVTLGAETQVVLRPHHAPDPPVAFTISTHAARRNGIEEGVSAKISLLAEGIHLMPISHDD